MSALTGPWCPGKVTAILSEGSLALRLQLNQLCITTDSRECYRNSSFVNVYTM